MPLSDDTTVQRIPLIGIDEADLKELGTSALPPESRIEPRARTPGAHMDAATMAIVVPAITSIVVASISAIATIWVATINSRGKGKSDHVRAAKLPAVEIETFTTSVLIPMDDDFRTSLASKLPAPRSITAIRFIPGD